jgi:DNA topoisomerase-2
MAKKQSIEQTYKKMEQIEHILKLPDTYIGSVEEDEATMWIYDDDKKLIVSKKISYVPGFYKTFDELLVNARDHQIRDENCKNIKMTIDEKNGSITIFNDGAGIPVQIHKEYGIYVPELIFGNLLTSSNYETTGKTVGGKNGLGSKCLSGNGYIYTWYKGKKLIKDAKIGDQIIGDDGKKRTIKKIIKGYGKMFEIKQGNGDTYYVNEDHILTLHIPDHKVIFRSDNTCKKGWSMVYWENDKINSKTVYIKSEKEKITCEECDTELSGNLGRHYKRMHPELTVPTKERKSPTKKKSYNLDEESEESIMALEELKDFSKKIDDNNVIDMELKEYMKLNKTTKSRLAGVRGKCVKWKTQEVSLDPYLLGLWLGDGSYEGYIYTCNIKTDTEIVDYLQEWCEENNGNLKINDEFHMRISSTKKRAEGPIKTQLKKYNITKDKHIPREYLINDKETRLKVLAGLIDSDGGVSRDGTRVQISQGLIHEQLANDIVFLARTLGLYCTIIRRHTTWKHDGEKREGEAFVINISGDLLEECPTRLPRKKCCKPKTHNTAMSTGKITVKQVEDDDFYGFELDGNQRFVINDFTVTHNCANIFSNKFIVETVDGESNKKYYQEFTDNMSNKTEPVVTKTKSSDKPYTKITYFPDFKRFGMKKGLTPDVIGLLKKRAYDVAACTNSDVKVYLNDELLKVKTFKDFINMHYAKPQTLIYEEINDRWKVGVVFAENAGHLQVSFVNGVWTYLGGTHVNYIATQITDKVKEFIKKKNKKLDIKPMQIKEHLHIFIDSVINDPSFSSQTKGELTTKVMNFGSTCDLPDKFIKKIIDTGLAELVMKFAEFKESNLLSKTDGKKVTSLNIPKLDDAHWAGTKRSTEATLILTEGDSAKSFATNGIQILGRDKYGAFPLKGKPINTRTATLSSIKSNTEFIALKAILGLKNNVTYEDDKDYKTLRYGHIIILTDQDGDGDHIKGLVINMLQSFWGKLLLRPGFLQTMSTPLVKVFKKNDKKNAKVFYTLSEFEKWEHENSTRGFTIKYYKGLGTSDAHEAKEIFKDFKNRLIQFEWNLEPSNRPIVVQKGRGKKKTVPVQDEITLSKSYDAITLAFEKERADDRKLWLEKYDKNDILEYNKPVVTYEDFVNKSLIHFSNMDVMRSIPSMVDGFKPSQRKILYAMLKKNQRGEIKVAQLSSYVAEHTAYKHGENSLQGAIVGMAQDYAGSNNINLLFPSGEFGTRRMGGEDSASPRYIFTYLDPIVFKLFIPADESILDHIIDEGDVVEPQHYMPIIPMILVNGAKGIGTGYSTTIPSYNPLDICENIFRLMDGKSMKPMTPWYNYFTGKIEKVESKKSKKSGEMTVDVFKVSGKYEIKSYNEIKITELPVLCHSEDYEKKFLNTMVDGYKIPKEDKKKDKEKGKAEKKEIDPEIQLIEKIVPNCGNETVDFLVTMKGNELQKLVKEGEEEIEKYFKLSTTLSISNIYLFNYKGIITKYDNVLDIIEEFYEYRLEMYVKRKKYYIRILENELMILKYKVQFINDILAKKILVEQKKKDDVIEKLEKFEYPKLSPKFDALEEDKTYNYLITMDLFAVTYERINDLNEKYKQKKDELDDYMKITELQLWRRELDDFVTFYNKWITDKYNYKMKSDDDNGKKTKAKTKAKAKAKK